MLGTLLVIHSSCGEKQEESKPPTGVCSYQISTPEKEKELVVGATGSELAQSLVITQEVVVKTVQLNLLKTGTPKGTLILKIQKDSIDAETEQSLNEPDAASQVAKAELKIPTDEKSSQTLKDEAAFYIFDFTATETKLAAGKYWFRLEVIYDATTEESAVKWSANTTNTFTTGQALKEDGIANSWTNEETVDTDLVLKVCI